ncbi:MAG: type II toxin-antitoxin system ParD family antitoxin [Planctomycetes bacterium]|nr:type II toxin-antitoxin system ParD family antitoxin [Planctomycetota bacterium]
MIYQFPPDLEDEINERMASGQYASQDDLFRDALRALRLQDADVIAVKEAIADMEAGDRGIPFDQFVEEFRKQHNVPQDA